MRVEDLASGVVVGDRFRLERILGRGSYGDVWLADVIDDPDLPKRVALKVYQQPQQSRATKLLLQEAATGGQFDHTRLVRVFGAKRLDGLVVMWMEYADGPTLLERLGSEDAPRAVMLDDALRWMEQIAEGLAYLHMQDPPFVHGDLKLDNIVLSPATGARLLDFGQSRAIEERFVATDGTGAFPYLAPEIIGRAEEGVGVRGVPSDVYAFGVIAYRFLTGRFPRRSIPEVINLVPYPRPRELNPSIPKELEALVLRCLEKKPEARYATGSELLAAVQDVRAELDSSALEEPAPLAAVEPLPTVASQLVELTETLVRDGRAEEAVDKLEEAMQRISTSPRLLMIYGAAAQVVGKLEAAHIVYRRTLAWLRRHGASDEELRDPMEARSNLDVQLKRYEDAVEAYRWLSERWPDKRWYRYRLGVSLGLAGRYRESIEVLQALHEEGPQTALVCAKIGFAHLQSRQVETAVQYFNEALMLDPSEPEALFNLGYIRAVQGHREKAQLYAERLAKVEGAKERARELTRLLGG